MDPRVKTLMTGLTWNSADQVSRLGLTRLAIFPLLLILLGAESFGDFVVAYSILATVGGAIAVAFSDDLIKNANLPSTHSFNEKLKITSVHCGIVTIFSLVLLLLILYQYRYDLGGEHLFFWLLVFSFHFMVLNPTEMLLVENRVNRDFRRLALIHLAGTISMAVLLILFPLFYTWSVVFAVMSWALVPAFYSFKGTPLSDYKGSYSHLLETGKHIFFYFMSSVVFLSTTYLDRIMLSLWWSAIDVTIFFSAVSLAMLFQAPAIVVASFIFSILAKIEKTVLEQRSIVFAIAGLVCVYAGVVYFVGLFFSEWLHKALYPNQHTAAISILSECAAATAFLSVQTLLRPFIIKFCSSIVILNISVVIFIFRLGLVFILIKTQGYQGAASALMYGTLSGAVIVLCMFIFSMKTSPRKTINQT